MKSLIKFYRTNNEIINYIIIGGITTIISLSTYYICVTIFFDANNAIELQISNVISWICSVVFAYFSNRIIVFKSLNKSKWKEFLKFVVSRVMTLIIDMLTMFILVTIFNINDKLSKILVQFIIIVLNYIFSKFLVFSNKL